MIVRHTQRLCASTLLLALATGACAQQRPLTGSMMALPAPEEPASAAPALADTTPPASALPPTASPFPAAAAASVDLPAPRREVGDTTRALLRMQAAGTQAGPARPMLGVEASLAWQRYLQSFTHPIPERFEQTLPQQGRQDR